MLKHHIQRLRTQLGNLNRKLVRLICARVGHQKVEMSENEAYPAPCGWKCSRCHSYRLWQHTWTK
jgi:hypothetical protein